MPITQIEILVDISMPLPALGHKKRREQALCLICLDHLTSSLRQSGPLSDRIYHRCMLNFRSSMKDGRINGVYVLGQFPVDAQEGVGSRMVRRARWEVAAGGPSAESRSCMATKEGSVLTDDLLQIGKEKAWTKQIGYSFWNSCLARFAKVAKWKL